MNINYSSVNHPKRRPGARVEMQNDARQYGANGPPVTLISASAEYH